MTLVNDRPEVTPAGRYSAAQTARLLGIHRNTLSKYTEQGRILPCIHKATGRKYYLGREILRFWEQHY